jgi:hypothetical protein
MLSYLARRLFEFVIVRLGVTKNLFARGKTTGC